MEIKPNNILLVGNGFDLAHGLLTSYENFLFLMQNWSEFYEIFLQVKQGGDIKKDSPYFKYTVNAKYMDDESVIKLGEIIKTNSWALYYQKCGAEIDGWIDFEREMYPVLDLFAEIFEAEGSISGSKEGYIFRIKDTHIDSSLYKIVGLLLKYFSRNPGVGTISVNAAYVSGRYGILKKTIMKSLKEELDDFISALEIYLYEFVYKKENVKKLKQISEIKADCVISFNYTLTEQLYNISEDKVHHIHGAIQKDLNADTNNMVLGVNERTHQNIDFIYFVKYFQRIQKNCGTQYKDFLEKTEVTSDGFVFNKPYNLYIYGHSLDITDEDILKYVIGDFNENKEFKLKPEQVIIYYYDQVDFERKVISLINLYGRAVVEEYMENDKFHFAETTDETI